jgi:1-aminocyclopropane-1-carboxylate deaminase/D-cysteine desulfhydrase-like pyridoxal-dependent ACC family enzyme
LDLIHPIVSGNKLFKLYHYVEEAQKKGIKRLITSGGAYSNHIIATAFYARENGFQSAAIVRGEEPKSYSPTLIACRELGMELYFTERANYDTKDTQTLWSKFNSSNNESCFVIPEGGFGKQGSKGIEALFEQINTMSFTHICTPVGTATTFAGLINGSEINQQIIGISVLKNLNDIDTRLNELVNNRDKNNFSLWTDYHFGGYAKKNKILIDFLNECYLEYQLPLDFVYTGKMIFGVFDNIKKGFFPANSKVLCLHTGGLQGNNSLPEGTLVF